MTDAASDDTDAITKINVAPLVDITLVLLIIFMVTAKLSVSTSVPLDLPKVTPNGGVQRILFSVVLRADGTTLIDDRAVSSDDLVLAEATAARGKNNGLRAIIKADSAVSHARVIHVLDLLKQAQVSKIAFGVPAKASALAPRP